MMKRKVAKGLLIAVVLSNNILGTTNVVVAMNDINEMNAIIQKTEENAPVEAENNSTVLTSEEEEVGTVALDESNTSDLNEENSKDASIESNTSDTREENELESQTVEEISNTTTTTTSQINSSASINPTTEVNVSNESDLRSALDSGDKKIILQQHITLSEPLEIASKNQIVIDGNGKKIVLNENASAKKNMFIVKYSDGIVVKNVTFEGYYSNGVSLYKSNNVFVENVTLIGQDISNSSDTRSNVGVDLDNSQATISDLVSMNHRYAGIRVRNESALTLEGWNEHTNDTNDIDSQVKTGANDNLLNNVNNNYTEWQVKPGSDSSPTSTIFKVMTKREVSNVKEFKEAIAIPNTTIVLRNEIEINEQIDIKSKNITVEGNGFQIKVTSNTSTNNGTNTAGLAVKSENAVLKNLTIKNDTTKPGLTLYGAKNAKVSDVTIIGIEPNGQDKQNRSGVALDIYKTTVELTNITCSNSLYRDFQVRGGSTVTLLSKNTHSADVVHMQTIQKTGETKNTINDDSKYYTAGVEFDENGDKKMDCFLKVEVPVTTLEGLLQNLQQGGAVINLTDNIKVPKDAVDLEIEVGRNVTINGNGKTLDLNDTAQFILKGKDIVVKNLDVINSYKYGINIYNSKNVLLEKVNVKNSRSHGIFVNGSTVVLRDFATSSNGAEGIKVTRFRTLNSPSHFDSEVIVEGSSSQKESNISVVVNNLEMIDGYKQDNKFIPIQGTYTEYENDVEYKKISQENIDLFKQQGIDFDENKEYWEQSIDYLVLQGKLNVTTQTTVTDESGNPIQLVGDGVVDNTDNLIKLIEYAALHSQELYFPAGTYKITADIDLSQLNLPAASNFQLTGDPNGLSIIDGSNSLDKMHKIFNDEYHAKMNYVNIEHLVFNNVGIAINGPYKKGITLKNNVFMNGNYNRELRDDGSVSKATMEPYIQVRNNKYLIEKNIFLRGTKYPGRGISTYRSKNTKIIDNYFGNLDGIDDVKQMIPELANKLSIVKASGLTESDQGNFFTAINNERYDTNVLIQNNYFNMVKTRNVLSDFESNTLISGINVATDGQRRDHIIYSKGYDNLQIVGNYFEGQENGTAGGVKIRNGKNAYIGANHFNDVPLLTYIYPDLTKAETLLYNTVIYNNLFHQKTNFGEQGTGILFYQSFRDGDNLTYSDGSTWDNAYGDVQDFIIYKNIFKSDERDRITISGRAQKAFNDNQFLAYDNNYKNTNTLVNYNTTGNLGLTESTLDVIQDKVVNNTGFTLYKDAKIPLTPVKVDYTYLKEIYDDAKVFLDDIIKHNLVGDTPGKYPTNLVKQLQDMIAEIDKLYNDGKLLQSGTNTFVTYLEELYGFVINSKIPDAPGNNSDDEENVPSDEENTEEENGSGGEEIPGEENSSGSGETPGEENSSGGRENPEDGNSSESTGGTINKPTTDEQQTIDKLPQTGEVCLGVLTALGILLIIIASLLLMKRSRTE